MSVVSPVNTPAELLEEGAKPAAGRAQFEVLHGRKIYILPTRQGFAFGGMLVVMLLGSANYDNGLGYALVFLLASLSLVSLVHTYRNLAGLKVRLSPGAASFSGRPANFQLAADTREGAPRPAIIVRLRPTGSAMMPPTLASRHHCADVPPGTGVGRWWRRLRRPREHHRDAVTVVDLKGGALARIDLSPVPQGRGWLYAERLVVATRYPFGLFRAWSVPFEQASTAACLIYPAPAGSQPMPTSGGAGRLESGEQADGQDDFAGLRDYHPGDSPKRIDWKALARERGVLVKQFTGGAPAELVLDWAGTVGATEHRISQLTRWVLEADAAGSRYSLNLDGQRIGPGEGRTQRDAALRALAGFRLPTDMRSISGSGSWTGGV